MNAVKNRLKGMSLSIFFLAIGVQSAHAATYVVTSQNLTGPGSFLEAIEMANNNPGQDVIEFTPNLRVDAVLADPVDPVNDYNIANITDSVVIDGKGGTLLGKQVWITSGGKFNDVNACPEEPGSGTILIAQMPGFISIGKYNQDNGITVTVKNLTVKQFNTVATMRKNTSLELDNFTALDTWATRKCNSRSMIGMDDRASSLTIRDSRFSGYYNWGSPGTAPAISGGGTLNIENSRFDTMEYGRNPVILWSGPPSSVVNIVSSRFLRSGGIWIGGNARANIVNTIWANQAIGAPSYGERMFSSSSGDMNFVASSLVWSEYSCDPTCKTNQAIFGVYPLIFRAGSGKINFSGTAIGFNFSSGNTDDLKTLADVGTGGITADPYTWIQPTAAQAAQSLKDVTGQPNLRTAPSAFNSPVLDENEVAMANPKVSGELIDKIPSSETLLNPITNTELQTDVLGNPRKDANGLRNIGALQLGLAPNLSVDETGDGYVTLTWSQPPAQACPVILSYTYRYARTNDPGSEVTDFVLDIPPGPLVSQKITELQNGTEYTFAVRAECNSGTGPFSNEVKATPYGAVGRPEVSAVPGDRQVQLFWTEPTDGGHGGPLVYTVVYRPVGTDAWIAGPSFLTARTTIIPGLKNGTAYEFGVYAAATDGASSEQGLTTATPYGDIGTVNRSPDERLSATAKANNPRYWEQAGYGKCTKTDLYDGYGSVLELQEDASALILKSDGINDVWVGPTAGMYGTASAKDISHVIVCMAR